MSPSEEIETFTERPWLCGGLIVYTDESSLAAEIAKKTTPPPFERIPSKTANRVSDHRIISDIMVNMRDGVRLATDVYLPKCDGPFPCILKSVSGVLRSGRYRLCSRFKGCCIGSASKKCYFSFIVL